MYRERIVVKTFRQRQNINTAVHLSPLFVLWRMRKKKTRTKELNWTPIMCLSGDIRPFNQSIWANKSRPINIASNIDRIAYNADPKTADCTRFQIMGPTCERTNRRDVVHCCYSIASLQTFIITPKSLSVFPSSAMAVAAVAAIWRCAAAVLNCWKYAL